MIQIGVYHVMADFFKIPNISPAPFASPRCWTPQKSTESARSCAHGPFGRRAISFWVANYEHGRPSNGDRNI